MTHWEKYIQQNLYRVIFLIQYMKMFINHYYTNEYTVETVETVSQMTKMILDRFNYKNKLK